MDYRAWYYSNMSKLTKQREWFVPLRGSYIPCAWQGWALYIPFVLFLAATMYLSFKGGRTYVGQLYFVFPQYVAALVVMHWIAARFVKNK